jgi:hypothetical protein
MSKYILGIAVTAFLAGLAVVVLAMADVSRLAACGVAMMGAGTAAVAAYTLLDD